MPTALFLSMWQPCRHVHPATGLQPRMRMLAKRKPAHARTRREKNKENKDYKYLVRYPHYNAPVLENIAPQNKRKGVAKVLGNIAPQHNPKRRIPTAEMLTKSESVTPPSTGSTQQKRTPRSTGTPFLTFATPHEEYAHHVFDTKCPKYWKT